MATALLLSLIPWATGAYLDIRYRRAPNYLWPLIGSLGVVSMVAGSTSWLSALFAAAILTPVALWLWGQEMVGGADCKAMLVLPVYGSLAWPVLAVSSLMMVPYLLFREGDEPIPMLVPLSAAVVIVVTGTVLSL